MKTYPRMIAPGVAVIGRYKPRKKSLDAKQLGKHLSQFTVDKGYETGMTGFWLRAEWGDSKLGAEVRSPSLCLYTIQGPTAAPWHRDGGGITELGMITWSNREQTEIRLPNGTEIKPTPGDILLIDNTAVQHRAPQDMSEDRWFFRRFVKVPDWLRVAK